MSDALDARPLSLPEIRLDERLHQTAERLPTRPAIRCGDVLLTFAQLDAAVSRLADTLRDLTAPGGCVIGLANAFDPCFAVAYYAILRSGNTLAILNRLQSGQALAHMLRTAGVRLAFVTDDMRTRLAPELADADRVDLVPVPAALTPSSISTGVAAAPGPRGAACVLFTSGTTGLPKGVLLSHRNLVANAAQIVRAHRLSPNSVTVNHLPSFHPMHLNSAVWSGATQVLCTDPDPVAATRLAVEVEATHYYSLPMRLAQLARDTRLRELRLDTVRAILSGGSALAPASARALTDHFGVAVMQGYGLAETSPLTHCDQPPWPKYGSVGPPVAETGCRIVDVTTRAVLPAGERGEVQVRGPQIMLGYLDTREPSPIDADGWLSTGDIGRLDQDGYLFLIDRLKDTFKYDDNLVAPAEIEQVLATHPAVADCVVVDTPDPLHGAVANALVVPRAEGITGDEIAMFLNDRVPVYQRLARVVLTTSIPRGPGGKTSRAALRDLLGDPTAIQ
ncbi:class I adenylate-forming enzyme family protein [Nonomuraea sp. CA-143628]|uniref:class I adenylate-forming enzyme family protein n=1 Tax=Nonomuraea sp. CA-143628 TaxID=3239997 RepID=UPI003D9219F3